MVQFNAHFDGRNICPDEPVSIPENVPLRVTVDEAASTPATSNRPLNLFDRLASESGLIEGPTDWAAEHDHYLYGAPKKSAGSAE